MGRAVEVSDVWSGTGARKVQFRSFFLADVGYNRPPHRLPAKYAHRLPFCLSSSFGHHSGPFQLSARLSLAGPQAGPANAGLDLEPRGATAVRSGTL